MSDDDIKTAIKARTAGEAAKRDTAGLEKKHGIMKRHSLGYLYGFLAALLYALISIVAKHLITGGSHPVQITFFQYVFTVSILGIWILLRKPDKLRCSIQKIGCFALLGIFGGGSTNLLFYSALKYLDAGIASMLLFLHPVFITVFFAVTKIKALKPVNYFCVIIAASGAAVVLDVFSGTMSFSAVGVLFGMLSGGTYAFYNIYADLKLKEEEPNVINFYACIAAMFLTMAMLAFSGIGFKVEVSTLPSIFFLAVFSGVLPAYCFFKALQYIGSEKVSVISSVELPLTLTLAFLFLKEHMKPFQLFGIILIVLATVVLHRNEGGGGADTIADTDTEHSFFENWKGGGTNDN